MQYPEEGSKIEDWVPFAKQHKEHIVESTERGDISPTVIVEKNGKVQMIVISPDIDKNLGLQAAAVLHSSIDPDSITLIMDAHFAMGKREEGQTDEEAQEAFRKKFPPGSMQKMCDEEVACEAGLITDCLLCYRITRDLESSVLTIPYAYHGKQGPPFKWLDNNPEFVDKVLNSKDGGISKGYIPDSLVKIMKSPVFVGNESKLLRKVAETFLPEEREERIFYHTARAIMAMLSYRKFMIVDFISGTRPEWTGAKERGNSLIEKMCEDGFFPQEASEPCLEIINNHIATKEFQKKFAALLQENSYWLPASIRSEVEKFAYEFESVCVSPMMPKFDEDGKPINPYADEMDDSDDEDDEDDDDDDEWDDGSSSGSVNWGGKEKKARRVRVWNGDKSEFLGEGNYVGDVKVYFIRLEDGSIQSNRNAEEKPDPTDIPEGADIIKAGKNPKIILDNGETVYGCQVWFDFKE